MSDCDVQIEGWRNVTEAMHAEAGRIYLQIWHAGRMSHPAFRWWVAGSAISGGVRRTDS
ncbi:hypothetical protein LGN26_35950 [Burkholderia cepacia]|nr:hypothetical protein [Burkholderia cepacia]